MKPRPPANAEHPIVAKLHRLQEELTTQGGRVVQLEHRAKVAVSVSLVLGIVAVLALIVALGGLTKRTQDRRFDDLQASVTTLNARNGTLIERLDRIESTLTALDDNKRELRQHAAQMKTMKQRLAAIEDVSANVSKAVADVAAEISSLQPPPEHKSDPPQALPDIKRRPATSSRIYLGETLKVGMRGKLANTPGGTSVYFRVEQVVDADEMLIRALYQRRLTRYPGATAESGLTDLWLKGEPTSGIVDGARLDLKGFFEISGTKTFQTMGGGTRTIFIIRRLD